LMELSVVFCILKCGGILLYQSWAIEGSWNRCRFSKMVLCLISPLLCAFLNEAFTGQWIGCSTASPLALPQSSLYLTTPGNSLWGIIKKWCGSASLWHQCCITGHLYWCVCLFDIINSMEDVTKDVVMHQAMCHP
jgi:hypothetical protein